MSKKYKFSAGYKELLGLILDKDKLEKFIIKDMKLVNKINLKDEEIKDEKNENEEDGLDYSRKITPTM